MNAQIEAVLKLHSLYTDGFDDGEEEVYEDCAECGKHWPCPTVEAIEALA